MATRVPMTPTPLKDRHEMLRFLVIRGVDTVIAEGCKFSQGSVVTREWVYNGKALHEADFRRTLALLGAHVEWVDEPTQQDLAEYIAAETAD